MFASTTEMTAVQIALAYSGASDSALVLVDGSEANGAVRSLVSTNTNPATLMVGNAGISDELDADDADKFGVLTIDGDSSIDASYDAVTQQMIDTKGASAMRVVAAPSNDLGSFAIASMVARSQRAVLIPAGKNSAIDSASPANRYVGLLESEMTGLTLVGKGLTTTQLAAVAKPAGTARASAPAWTVTSVSLGSGNYTVQWTARSGASSYKALKYDGTVLGKSTTTALTLSGTPNILTLVAYNSSGGELERIYFRSNSYTKSAERTTAVFGTIRNGAADIRILGPAGVPRKIIRHLKDPYADMSVVPPAPETVAVTCKTSFTDTDLNPRVQWTYEVVAMTMKTGSGCGGTAGTPISGSALPVGGIQLPLTEDPWATTAKSEVRSSEDSAVPRAEEGTSAVLPRVGQTVTDAARERMAYEQSHPGAARSASQQAVVPSENAMAVDATAAAAAGSPGSGFEFSYQAYIPEAFIVGPAPSGNPFKPLVLFNGSNRDTWDVNNIHNKFDMRAYVGGTEVGTTKSMGQTERWNCTLNPFNPDCEMVAYKTASVDELDVSGSNSGGVTTINFTASATNPLQDFAPAIDGSFKLVLTDSSWTLSGTHDRMPVHQFWWAPFYSEGTLAYDSSDFYFLPCLFGGPNCVANVNVRL
ncbi:hypothetical protein AB0O90_04710 [Microbacterium testaceum]|uniref:hypothetical protein n=1 Tax=Microbacterium testaceum TaxID=2033 RepID=UPI0034355A33